MKYYEDSGAVFYRGDCCEILRGLPESCVQTCVTSPPYWGLRDYQCAGQIGLEDTPEAYVARMVEVFREVRRVLRDDGTLWLNLGDSYSGSGPSGASYQSATTKRRQDGGSVDGAFRISKTLAARGLTYAEKKPIPPPGLKHKDLVGIPWRVAFALQADGWWLRQDIIWHKPNPMPESVRDRCTKAHEYVFLLSKSPKYYFDSEAMKEPAAYAGQMRGGSTNRYEQNSAGMDHKIYDTRNKRSVWSVPVRPYKGAHFATFPPALIEPCVKAGCPEGGTVLDPFLGSGTTAQVARKFGRTCVGCELNEEYLKLAVSRFNKVEK